MICHATLASRHRRRPGAVPGGRVAEWWRVACFVGLTSALLVPVGCSTPEPVATQTRHKFIRTQSEDQVTLQWEGRPGQMYSVLYATDLNQRGGWRPVPGYGSYVARSATTRITFRAPVPGAKIYYRVEEGVASRR